MVRSRRMHGAIASGEGVVTGAPRRWLGMSLALVWLAHIGMDRLLGMGLKYGDRFTHTYLGDRPDAREAM